MKLALALLLTLPVAAQSFPNNWHTTPTTDPPTQSRGINEWPKNCHATALDVWCTSEATDLTTAQSIPATWPDRMDAKPIAKLAKEMCVYFGESYEPLLVPDRIMRYCFIPGHLETIHEVSELEMTVAAIPPAKHHSTAPTGHKSHARRKVRK